MIGDSSVAPEPIVRRTVVHIDEVFAFRGRYWMRLTPAGVELPPGALFAPVSDLPEPLRATAAPGRVFFAQANLNAERSCDAALTAIEDEWGETGPLHFDAERSR